MRSTRILHVRLDVMGIEACHLQNHEQWGKVACFHPDWWALPKVKVNYELTIEFDSLMTFPILVERSTRRWTSVRDWSRSLPLRRARCNESCCVVEIVFSHLLELERIFFAVILCQCFPTRCSNIALSSANLVEIEVEVLKVKTTLRKLTMKESIRFYLAASDARDTLGFETRAANAFDRVTRTESCGTEATFLPFALIFFFNVLATK